MHHGVLEHLTALVSLGKQEKAKSVIAMRFHGKQKWILSCTAGQINHFMFVLKKQEKDLDIFIRIQLYFLFMPNNS